jgi:TctA family transporter
MINFLPSMFLGVPEEGTVLSVLLAIISCLWQR